MSLVVPVRFGRQNMLPQAPPELQEEVELYARESGRTAKLHFVPGGGWFVRFSLRVNDERMRAFQEGRASEPPSEDDWFHVKNPYEGQVTDVLSKPDIKGIPVIRAMCEGIMRQGPYLPLDIHQLGRSGIRQFLEKRNTWSGRGEYASVEEAVKKALEMSQQQRTENYEKQKTENRLEQRDKRRWRLGIPFKSVGIDLKNQKGA